MKLLQRLFMGTILLVSACATPVSTSSLDPSVTMIGDSLSTVASTELLFVNLKINPDVELIIDDNNVVVAVVAKNEEGEVLIAGLELIGLDIEAATALIIEEALAAGYLPEATENLVEIEFAVTGEDQTAVDDLETNLDQSIKSTIENKAIYAIALNRKIIDSSLIEAAKVAGLTIDEYLLKVLGDTIGFVYDDSINYGQNISNLVKLLNEIRENKDPNQARVRTNQRTQEKVALMLEANERRMVTAAAKAQAGIDEINGILNSDMSGLTEQERLQLKTQLETMLQTQIQLRSQAQLALNQAETIVADSNDDDPETDLETAETSTLQAMEALRNAFQVRTQLQVHIEEAVMTATQAKAKVGANPPAPKPGGPNG